MDFKKQGKRNRANGAAFELRVRKDLEEKGWIVSKWMNNVELICTESEPIKDTKFVRGTKFIGKLIPSKRKYAGPGRPMAIGTGFPDFITFKEKILENHAYNVNEKYYEVIGVEVKTNGYLDKAEKEKCDWYLENKIFSKILIASKEKEKNRIKIVYKEYRKD